MTGLMAVAALWGQEAPGVARQRAAVERQRERMAAGSGLERQKVGVDRQREKALRQQGESFFALPWPERVQSVAQAGCGRVGGREWDLALEQSAREHDLSPELLRAVVRRESGFNPCAVSRAGAMGLMQLMPETAAAMGVVNPFDPGENLRGGSRFLQQMLERYGGNLGLALGAYNAGPGRVDRSGGIPPIRETQEYVRAILGELGIPQ